MTYCATILIDCHYVINYFDSSFFERKAFSNSSEPKTYFRKALPSYKTYNRWGNDT